MRRYLPSLGAGHAFLFQDWTRFASLVNSFLAGNPG